MNQLQIFENPEFGKIRSVTINGEPWLVGKDVATALGYSNTRDAIYKHVDQDDKGVAKCDTHGGTQELSVVNESGLYALIFGSKLPSAREFKRWVTSEVLPSIRKHGGYLQGQNDWTREEMFAQSLLFANSVMEERAERIRMLEKEAAERDAQIELAAPKVEYYDNFIDGKTSTNIRTTAKEIGVPERKFVQLLLDREFLYRDKQGELLPYTKKNRDYFIVRDFATGRWIGKQTFVTEKGKRHLRRLCLKAGLLGETTLTELPFPS